MCSNVTMGATKPEPFTRPILFAGRYAVFEEIAHGGFASIHVGRTVGAGGFARTVAIKRLHAQYAKDPEVSAMFLDEARVVARIRHPNVCPTLDLIAEDDELFIVMEYIEGVTLRHLLRDAAKRKRSIPLGVALKILAGALHGLQAAHDAKNEQGEPMELVHRDVSPDNVLIGIDGMPRLLDFGVARALGQYHNTRDGEVKGKLHYITPEQVRGEPITSRSDLFSASVVLWEAMTTKRLFQAKSVAAIAHDLLTKDIPEPSEIADTPRKLDGIVMQGLERDPSKRWQSCAKMAAALEAVGELASDQAVARYVRQVGADRIAERAAKVAKVEAVALDIAPRDTMTSFLDLSDARDKSGEIVRRTPASMRSGPLARITPEAPPPSDPSGAGDESASATTADERGSGETPGVEITGRNAMLGDDLAAAAEQERRKKVIVIGIGAAALLLLLLVSARGSSGSTRGCGVGALCGGGCSSGRGAGVGAGAGAAGIRASFLGRA